MWRALALLLILTASASAQTGSQKTTTQLNTEINTLFPDNTTGIITPNALRQVTLDQVASFANTASANSFLSLQTFLAGWAVTGTFPASFGASPTSEAVLNIGSYPTAGMIPWGVFQGIVSAMVVPSTWAGGGASSWPNNNYNAYCDNQFVGAGSACVGVYSLSLADGSSGAGAGAWGYVSEVANTDPLHWANGAGMGIGKNFQLMVGMEIDAEVFKVGAATPAGEYDAVRIITFMEANPTSSSYGVHILPAPTSLPISFGFKTEVGATIVGVDLGPLATGSSQSSQSIILRSTGSGGGANVASLFLDLNDALNLTSNVIYVPGAFTAGVSNPTPVIQTMTPGVGYFQSNVTGVCVTHLALFPSYGEGVSAGQYNLCSGGAFAFWPNAVAIGGTPALAISAAGRITFSQALVSAGTPPTGTTGTCNTGVTVAGGAVAGTWTSTGVCALGTTIILTGLPTTPTGYYCDITDRTTNGVTVQQTATSVSSATFTVRTLPTGSIATVANDILQYKCLAY